MTSLHLPPTFRRRDVLLWSGYSVITPPLQPVGSSCFSQYVNQRWSDQKRTRNLRQKIKRFQSQNSEDTQATLSRRCCSLYKDSASTQNFPEPIKVLNGRLYKIWPHNQEGSFSVEICDYYLKGRSYIYYERIKEDEGRRGKTRSEIKKGRYETHKREKWTNKGTNGKRKSKDEDVQLDVNLCVQYRGAFRPWLA